MQSTRQTSPQSRRENETVELDVTLVPLAAANATTDQANVTAPAAADTLANVTADVTTAAATSPAPTPSGSLPFAAFAAFGVIGILAIRSRR